jgi:hypothetical protein
MSDTDPTLKESLEEMDSLVPGWREMEPEEVRRRISEHVDDLLDLVNDLDALKKEREKA